MNVTEVIVIALAVAQLVILAVALWVAPGPYKDRRDARRSAR